MNEKSLRNRAKNVLPAPVYQLLAGRWRHPAAVRQWQSLRRLTPVSRNFGLERGQSIMRYYIEPFLTQHAADIRGAVLEIGDRRYTTRFGGDRVTNSVVLHAVEGNPEATVVGDLSTGEEVPADAFDCAILTQVLFCIYDIRGAVANTWKALKPGGVVLATVPGISQISRVDGDKWGDFWRFTDASARRLFGDVFGDENVTVITYGNVLAACAFLHGVAAHELEMTSADLDFVDPDYQILIGIRAVKR